MVWSSNFCSVQSKINLKYVQEVISMCQSFNLTIYHVFFNNFNNNFSIFLQKNKFSTNTVSNAKCFFLSKGIRKMPFQNNYAWKNVILFVYWVCLNCCCEKEALSSEKWWMILFFLIQLGCSLNTGRRSIVGKATETSITISESKIHRHYFFILLFHCLSIAFIYFFLALYHYLTKKRSVWKFCNYRSRQKSRNRKVSAIKMGEKYYEWMAEKFIILPSECFPQMQQNANISSMG